MTAERGHRLLGFSVVGRPPIGSVNLRLDDRVMALYGRNGAGKTRILDEVRDVLRGGGGEVLSRVGSTPSRCAHVEVTDDVGELAWQFHFLLADRVREEVSRDPDVVYGRLSVGALHDRVVRASQDSPDEEPYAVPLAELTRLYLDAFLNPRHRFDEDDGHPSDLAQEIAAQRLYVLDPDGSAHVGEWGVWIAARPNTPALQETWELAGRAAANARREPEDADGWAALFDEQPWSIRDLVAAAMVRWRTQNPDAAEWVPVPIAPLHGVIGNWGALAIRNLAEQDLDAVTASLLREQAGSLISAIADDDFELRQPALDFKAELEGRANALYPTLLVDAPTLVCRASHPEHWDEVSPLEWRAIDAALDVSVPLQGLSSAQQTWANLAIAAALGGAEPRDETVTIIDEPERGLHVSAITHMLAGLKSPQFSATGQVILATHSPAVLNDQGVHLVHVHRGADGLTTATSLDSPLGVDLDDLGITRAELLQMYRVVLLVEGTHDKAVVEELIGDDLRDARALVVPVRGTKSLSAADAALLFDYTTANVVLMLDNIRTGRIGRAWTDARVALEAPDSASGPTLSIQKRMERAVSVLHQGLPRDASGEERTMVEFLDRAIRRGRQDRVSLVGIAQPDIIDLLPVDHFVPDDTSWADLRSTWSGVDHREWPDFKKWVSHAYGARISEKTIRTAARSLAEVPSEIVAVAGQCRWSAMQSGI